MRPSDCHRMHVISKGWKIKLSSAYQFLMHRWRINEYSFYLEFNQWREVLELGSNLHSVIYFLTGSPKVLLVLFHIFSFFRKDEIPFRCWGCLCTYASTNGAVLVCLGSGVVWSEWSIQINEISHIIILRGKCFPVLSKYITSVNYC